MVLHLRLVQSTRFVIAALVATAGVLACVGGPGDLSSSSSGGTSGQTSTSSSSSSSSGASSSSSSSGATSSGSTTSSSSSGEPVKAPAKTDYDSTCTQASDCVAVWFGSDNCCGGCPNDAINKKDQAKYTSDQAKFRSSCAAGAPCPAIGCQNPTAACTNGRCQAN